MNKLAQVTSVDTIWAISDSYKAWAESVLATLDVLECARLQADFDAEQRSIEIEAATRRKAQGEPDPKPYMMVGSTALFFIKGPMTKKPTSASFLFGGASTIVLRERLRSAKADPDVKQILNVWETPGGQVAGLAEYLDDIRETNAVKPVYSFIDDECASAGYYGASGSAAIWMNRMGKAGCIGTVLEARDSSAAAAIAGVKVNLVATGPYKGMGTPGTPLEPHHIAHLAHLVKHHGDDFKTQVAFGRGMTDEQVATVADGRMFTADEALELGLIDGICSLEECLAMISSGSIPDRKPAARNGKPTQENTMSDDKKSFWQRLIAMAKEDGLDIEAGGGAPTQAAPTAPATTTTTVATAANSNRDAEALALANARIAKADEAVAKALVETACGHFGADTRAAVLPLALLAVKSDAGEVGEACKAFHALAVAGKPATDMRRPMISQIAEQPGMADDLKAQTERAMAGAVAAINNGGL